jgi:hypothetical protein
VTTRFVFALVVTLLPLLLICAAVHYQRLARRRTGAGWEDLIGRLRPLDRVAIQRIAASRFSPDPESADDLQPDPAQIWNLIGGMEGVEALEANCDVLIELACYVQQWHPEAVVVAEHLRLNAREIKWHLQRLRGAAAVGHLRTAFPDYAPQAVATYFLMTQRLLALYEVAGFTGPALQNAI